MTSAANALHRFIAAYIRYATHVGAFVQLIGRRFPGFTGRAGSYEIDLVIAPPESQNRWKTLFRFFLAIPACVASALGGVLLVVAFLGWWYALVTGRMPEGLRNLGASCLRYEGQTYAYLWLLTDRYPYAAPVLRDRRGRRSRSTSREPRLGPRRRALRIAFAVGIAAILAVGAFLLFPTEHPGRPDPSAGRRRRGLRGRLSVTRAERFERFHYLLWALLAVSRSSPCSSSTRGEGSHSSQPGPISTGMLLGMLGIAIAWLVHPFRVVAHWWAGTTRRISAPRGTGYGSARCGLRLALHRAARRHGARALARRVVVAARRRRLRRNRGALLVHLPVPRLRDDEAARGARARRPPTRTSVSCDYPEISLRVEEVSDYTDLANAYAVGFGPSRRVLFWDTLLMEPFTEAQQKTSSATSSPTAPVPRIVDVTVGRRRRQSQRLLKMLLGCRALVGRIFGNREIDQQNRILRA